MTSMPRNHHVQALRGVAASLVVLDHAFGPLIERGLLPQWFDVVRYSIGGLGVYIFFVISGFIMINMSYHDFGHAAKSLSFAERRTIRIVPIYWIATLLAFALYTVLPLSRHPSFLNLLQSLTFIPCSTDPNADMEPVLGQGWTLNYEMFFYALFTLALLAPRRIGLPGLLLAFIGLVAAGSWIKPFSDVSPATTTAAFLADPIILLFAVGMLVGVLKQELQDKIAVRYPFQIAFALITVQITLLVIFRVPPRVPFPVCIWTWLPGILAVAVCAWAAPRSQSDRFEATAEILGEASYSTYLFHVFVVFALSRVFPITAITAVPYVVITLIASTVVGILFFRLVERPTTSFLRAMPSWRVAPLEGRA